MAFARVDQREQEPFFPSTSGATAAMGVVFDLVGKLMVDDEGQVRHIDAAGGNIGGDEHANALFFEAAHDFIALGLHQVAVEDIDGEISGTQLLREFDGDFARATENQAALFGMGFEKFSDAFEFFIACGDEALVIDVSIDDVASIYFQHRCVARHVLADELSDAFRNSGGKQPSGAASGQLTENHLQLLLKAHAEHFIGFIEDEMAHVFECESAAFEQIDEATGSDHYDVSRAFERFDLAVDFIATSQDFDEDLGAEFRVAEKLFADLFRELAGRSDDEPLDLWLRGIDFVQQRQDKSGSLAGAGLCLSDEITILFQQ